MQRSPLNKYVRKDKDLKESADVDLANARAGLSSRKRLTAEQNLAALKELDSARLLLDQGLCNEVKQRLAPILSNPRTEPATLANARCLLSAALQMQGQYREALDA